MIIGRLTFAFFILVAAAFGQRPTLDDERINRKFQEARAYDLSRIVYVQNAFVIGNKEIGPPGQRHTLGSMEFPWAHPGGTFGKAITQKFVWPPDIRPASVRLERTNQTYFNPVRRQVIRPVWEWPEGATFFEMHYHPRGHAFELRMLEKVKPRQGFDSYEAKVFRPFVGEDDLTLHLHPVIEVREVRTNHPYNPFFARGKVHYYRDQRVDWKSMVNRVWKDSTGHDWHHAGLGFGWLSPKNYQGWIVGSDKDDCVKCHGDAGASVNKFEPFRDWYGFLPGLDGVFSFDPIDRSSVSFRGPNGTPVRWRAN